MLDNPDHDAIIHEAAHGCSLRDIARSHNLTVAEVRKIVDDEAALAFNGEQLRREWLLEARRLREIGQKYFSRAMMADDKNSATIFIKVSERLATLTGMNAPIGHAVQVMHSIAPQIEQTSTQRLRGILDNILKISPRERELLDRLELQGEDTPEIRDEINQLRAERGKPPYGEAEPAKD